MVLCKICQSCLVAKEETAESGRERAVTTTLCFAVGMKIKTCPP